MAISTEGNIVRENSMEKENIFGQTLQYFKEIFVKAWDMDMEHGNQQKSILTSMLDPIKMTKKVDMVDTYGQMDVFTKETFQKMLSNFLFYFRHGKGRLIYTDGR